MFDPKRLYQDRTPPPLVDAVRDETTRPAPPHPVLPSDGELTAMRQRHAANARFEKLPKWKRNKLRRKAKGIRG